MNEITQEKLVLVKDLGMKYQTATSKKKKRFGLYKCPYCQSDFEAISNNIKSGNTTSCGCVKSERISKARTTHGLTKHPLYSIWQAMVRRCYNKNCKDYKNYGAKGVTVSTEWKGSFQAFFDNMHPTWEQGLTIDRIDTLKNYNKENCRWVTMSVQAKNTRLLQSNNTSGYRGVSWDKCANAWIARIGVDLKSIYIGSFKTSLEAAIAYNNYIIDNELEHPKNLI